MKINKKQYDFIEFIESKNYVLKKDIDNSLYPDTMIRALLDKQLIFEVDLPDGTAIASTTGVIRL